jgi:hypothetical protein
VLNRFKKVRDLVVQRIKVDRFPGKVIRTRQTLDDLIAGEV